MTRMTRVFIQNVETGLLSALDGESGAEYECIAVGDKFTIAGVRTAVPNEGRKWWQFWKPRWRIGPLQTFVVTGKHSA